MTEIESGFDNIYVNKIWTNNNQYTLSGPGSSLSSANNIIKFLIDFIKQNNIKKIIDGSCGDCNWIMEVLKFFPDIEFIGNDVSTTIIHQNKETFANTHYSFYVKNAIEDEIENCDLFIFRHTMMHLSLENNLKILENMKRNCKYCLLTHHESVQMNQINRTPVIPDFPDALRWSQMNLKISPFYLNEKYLISGVLESSNNENEYANIYLLNRSTYHFQEFANLPIIKTINNIIIDTNEKLEGNVLYEHYSHFTIISPGTERGDQFDIKRNNLYKIAKRSKTIVEIGFNGGHSSCLYFYANPNIKLLSFDICYHCYTPLVATYLQTIYDFEFIKGDSLTEVPKYSNDVIYDAIHIDGGHGDVCVINDIFNCKKFADENTLIVFDDSNAPSIHKILEQYIAKNKIKEINYSEYGLEKCFYHRIFLYT